jgi:hypothetical protein
MFEFEKTVAISDFEIKSNTPVKESEYRNRRFE